MKNTILYITVLLLAVFAISIDLSYAKARIPETGYWYYAYSKVGLYYIVGCSVAYALYYTTLLVWNILTNKSFTRN